MSEDLISIFVEVGGAEVDHDIEEEGDINEVVKGLEPRSRAN